MIWPLGGQGSLSSVIQFAFYFFFLTFYLGCWNHFVVYRAILCGGQCYVLFHVETNVDRGGVWIERDFFFVSFRFSSCKNPRVERRNSSTPASVKPVNTLQFTDTILFSVPPTYPHNSCSAYHLTRPLPELCGGIVLCNTTESQLLGCWRNADCMWSFNEAGRWKGNSKYLGNGRGEASFAQP